MGGGWLNNLSRRGKDTGFGSGSQVNETGSNKNLKNAKDLSRERVMWK